MITRTCLSLSFLLSASLAVAQFDQPDNKHSTISTSDGSRIKDSDFAEKMMGLLLEDGESRVADAKFFFNQCFGGGFLDDINDAMGDAVKWVGGAASNHNETAIGQVTEAENLAAGGGEEKRYDEVWEADPPFSFWGKSLIDNLGDNNETIKKNLEDTRGADLTGPGQGGAIGMRRNPQVASGNGGDTIKLNDPEVLSHHAIIFAGNTDAERHFNTVNGVYDTLKNTWGDPATNDNVTITVLFGDGMKNSAGDDLPDEWDAMEATEANLDAAIAAVKPLLNENEQFLFYGYDHGGSTTDVIGEGESRGCSSDEACVETFELDPGEVEGMLLEDFNLPLLEINYQLPPLPLEDPIPVLVNGFELGLLDPLANQVVLPMPEFLFEPPLPDPFPQPIPVEVELLLPPELPQLQWGFTEFYTGSIGDVPLPLAPFEVLEGDFNGDGRVDNDDLNLLLANWGQPGELLPPEWIGLFIGPNVDNDELNALLANWGQGTGGAVPEPTTLGLVVLAMATARWRRR